MKALMAHFPKWNPTLIVPLLFLTSLIIYGIFYIGNALSPSSYGIFLNQLGAHGEGLVFGTPRDLRSDEWAVGTPFIQAAINNHFQRYNERSPYKEDLRNIYPVPLRDWSIPLKPTLLGFHFLPPAYAFSLHCYMIMTLFLVGYSLLFYRCGATPTIAIGLSLLVYFSSFVQNWWTAIGLSFAFFPWLYLTIIGGKTSFPRLAVFYYLCSCLLFSCFYPPIIYTLVFLSLLFLWAFHRSHITFKNATLYGFGIMLACATYLYYMKDSLEPMMHTVYPGRRSLAGGTVLFWQWLSQFIPSFNIAIGWDTHLSFAQLYDNILNICEVSTVGSYLGILLLIFGRWKHYCLTVPKEDIRTLAILGTGLLLISLWMFVPIPGSAVHWLFLDTFNPIRWFFASGVLLIGIMLILLKHIEIAITPRGLMAFQLFFIAMLVTKYACYKAISSNDIPIVLLILTLSLTAGYLPKKYLGHLLLSAALLNNICIFGIFNPLQSAFPIFNTPQTPFVASLYDKENYNEQGFFIGKLFGATANGLGLPSIGHVLIIPQLSFFRCYFPELPEERFNFIFNRYAHIQLQSAITAPINIDVDRSDIPRARFVHITPEIRSCLANIPTLSREQ